MPPCHVRAFVLPGALIAPSSEKPPRDSHGEQPLDAGHGPKHLPERAVHPPLGEVCDNCGSTMLEWRKCKLICLACKQINMTCSDL
jgi:hypothetical protein